MLISTQGIYPTQHNSSHLGTQGRVELVTLMRCLPFLTLPYSSLHRSVHPYRGVSYPFLLQYPTIPNPIIYTIGLLYPYTILHHSLMCPIEIGLNRRFQVRVQRHLRWLGSGQLAGLEDRNFIKSLINRSRGGGAAAPKPSPGFGPGPRT